MLYSILSLIIEGLSLDSPLTFLKEKGNKDMFNPMICSKLPEGFENLAKETPSITMLTFPIAAMLVVILLAVILTVIIAKKHKPVPICTFAGVSIFMLFNFFLVMILTMFIPRTSIALYIILSALMSTLVPFMGRMIVIKVFSRQQNTFCSHISYGVGIMDMKALVSLLTFLIPITNYHQLNKYGLEYFFTAEDTAEMALARAENFRDILSYDYSQYMFVMLMVIGVMLYSVSVSVPLYAAFTGQKGKSWYGFAFGMGFLVNVAECLYNNEMFVIPAVIFMLVVAIATAVISFKLYKTLDIEKEEKVVVQKEDIAKNAHVRIPKFKDLDKL